VQAAELLAEEGIFSRVLNMPMLKPIDEEAIARASEETGAIVTMEEHSVYGGLGSVVARVVVQGERAVPMRVVAIPDIYLESAGPEELLEIAGLTPENAAAKMKAALAQRG